MLQTLKIGSRIKLSGGYDHEPKWRPFGRSYLGLLTAFIPGQNKEQAAVITLDSPIELDDLAGEVAVLELRYADAVWAETGTVHIELCDFVPEPLAWKNRRQGKWIESHAEYYQI